MKVGVYIYIKKYFTNFNCRILPVTILSLFLMLHQASGNVADQKVIDSSISLKLASASIPDVLSALETKAGCVINYNRSLFKQNNLISIDVKNMRLEQVISKILANTRVGFKFADPHTILLYRLPDLVKPGKISGRVTDDKGETLPGASLRVIETGTGIQTGVDGSYILSLPPGTYTLGGYLHFFSNQAYYRHYSNRRQEHPIGYCPEARRKGTEGSSCNGQLQKSFCGGFAGPPKERRRTEQRHQRGTDCPYTR